VYRLDADLPFIDKSMRHYLRKTTTTTTAKAAVAAVKPADNAWTLSNERDGRSKRIYISFIVCGCVCFCL
jgi:hypothetical protein